MSWVEDEINRQEATALGSLHDIAMSDLDLAKQVLESWVEDGITYYLRGALFELARVASKDLELARLTAGLSWIIDGVTVRESVALQWLNSIADADLDSAKLAVRYANGRTGDLGSHFLQALWPIVVTENAFEQLTSRAWFADGLSDEQVALVVTLSRIHSTGALYHDLLQEHFFQSKTISLPLAGDVNVRVFQNTPFPPDDDLLTLIEDVALITEGFMGEPFPTTEIILLVVDISVLPVVYPASYLGRVMGADEEAGYVDIGTYEGSHMRVSRRGGRVGAVPHETPHYYFNSPYFSPTWLVEGAAEFAKAYFNHRKGIQDIDDRWKEVSKLVEDQCFGLDEIENIRHHTYLYGEGFLPEVCAYHMGENFLLTVFHSIGEETVFSALRDLYISRNATEERIYRTFLEHVPHDQEEEFRNMYRRLHGGSYAYPDDDRSDDHADEAVNATVIAVGETVEGNLDYMFDFDYFRFRAEEGQTYRMTVHHGTLRSTSVTLFADYELAAESWRSRKRTSSGPEILWAAPRSGDYHFAVQNFGGKKGTYRVLSTG